MAYATTDDMIARFGAMEMIQLSTPRGQDMDQVVVQVVQLALDDASAQADSYLRMKYATPLQVAPAELVPHVCHLARYHLSSGNDKTASEDMKNRRDEAVSWLRDIAAGKVKLDLFEVSDDDESTAMVSVRDDSSGNYPGYFY